VVFRLVYSEALLVKARGALPPLAGCRVKGLLGATVYSLLALLLFPFDLSV
jgi:hypothetical protein